MRPAIAAVAGRITHWFEPQLCRVELHINILALHNPGHMRCWCGCGFTAPGAVAAAFGLRLTRWLTSATAFPLHLTGAITVAAAVLALHLI